MEMQMIHPNVLDQLHMFAVAAELGSFSATAKRLGRAQNVVSYGISTLEQNLDVKLFDRSGHKAGLTPAGEALKKDALHLINTATALTRKAHELSAGVEAVLTIAIDDMAPFGLIQQALTVVAETYPGLELRINRTAGREAWNQVNDGRAVIGLAVDTIGLGAIMDIIPVGHVYLIPVINPLCALSDVDGDGYDVPDFRQIVLSGSDRPETNPDYGVLSPNIWRVPDLKSKYDLIREGLGWGTMPSHIVENDLASNSLRRLKLPNFTVDQEITLKLFSQPGAPLGLAGQLMKDQILKSASHP